MDMFINKELRKKRFRKLFEHEIKDGFGIENGVLMDYIEFGQIVVIPQGVTALGVGVFAGCETMVHVIIPEGVEHIGQAAFIDCSSLQSVVIPKSVKTIEKNAFKGCTSLRSIDLPEDLNVEKAYFNNSEELKDGDGFVIVNGVLFGYYGTDTNITIPNNVRVIGMDAFNNCEKLESVIIPEGVTSIGKKAFRRCESLRRITVPNSVKSIGELAFEGCAGLKSVTLPEKIHLDNGVFSDCIGLKDDEGFVMVNNVLYDYYGDNNVVIIPRGVTRLDKDVFFCRDGITEIVIPYGVTAIEDESFCNCDKLKRICIPESVTRIGDEAFAYCTALAEITIPNSVTEIGSEAFKGCEGLKCISIPESVRSIGCAAFSDCIGLEWVSVPESTTITECVFKECESLKNDEDMVIVNGVLFEYFGKDTDVIIPDGVTAISDYAFEWHSTMESITIPEGVTYIGCHAFDECSSLEEVIIPRGVTKLENWSFCNCCCMTGITLPESITDFGEKCFLGCDDLYNFRFPHGIPRVSFWNEASNEEIYVRMYLYGEDTKNPEFDRMCQENIRCLPRPYLIEATKRCSMRALEKIIDCIKGIDPNLIDELIDLSIEIRAVEITSYLMNYKNKNCKKNKRNTNWDDD